MSQVLSYGADHIGQLSEKAFWAECQRMLDLLKETMFSEDKRVSIETNKQVLVKIREVEEEMGKKGGRPEDREIASQWNEMKMVIDDRISLGEKEQADFMVSRMEHLLGQLSGSMKNRVVSGSAPSSESFAERVKSERLRARFLELAATTVYLPTSKGIDSAKRPTKKWRGGGVGDGEGKNEGGYSTDHLLTIIIEASLDMDNSQDMINLTDIVEEDSNIPPYIDCLMRSTKESFDTLIKHCRSLQGLTTYTLPRKSLRSLSLVLKNAMAALSHGWTHHHSTFRSDVTELLVGSLSSLLGYYTMLSACIGSLSKEVAQSSLTELRGLLHGAFDTCKGADPSLLPVLVDVMITGSTDTAGPKTTGWKHSERADISDKLAPLLESTGVPHPWKVYPQAGQHVEESVSLLVTCPREACLTRLVAKCIATALILGDCGVDGDEDRMRGLMRHLARLNEVSPSSARDALCTAACICSQQQETGTDDARRWRGVTISQLRALAIHFKIDVSLVMKPFDVPSSQREPKSRESDSDGVDDYRQMLANVRARDELIRGDGHKEEAAAVEEYRSGGKQGEFPTYEYGRPNVQLLSLLSCDPFARSKQARWEQVHSMNRLLFPRTTTASTGTDSDWDRAVSEAYQRDVDADIRAQVCTYLAKRSLAFYVSPAATSSSLGTFAQGRSYSTAASRARAAGLPCLLFTPAERSLGFSVGAEACPSVLHQLGATSRLQLDLVNRALVDNEVLVNVSMRERATVDKATAKAGGREESSLFFDGVLIPNLAAFTYYHLHLGLAMGGELSGGREDCSGMRQLPQLWREKRHLLVPSVLIDSLRYYLRLLTTPSHTSQESALALRYVAVALNLIACTACDDSDEDCCLALVGAAVDEELYSQCLETLLSGAGVRGSERANNVAVLAEALGMCLELTDTPHAPVASRSLRILPLAALCSMAVDLEISARSGSGHDASATDVKVAEVLLRTVCKGLPLASLEEETHALNGDRLVTVNGVTVRLAPLALGQSEHLRPLRSAMAEVELPGDVQRYLVLPHQPMRALFRAHRQLGDGSIAAANSPPGGAFAHSFALGFLPSLEETKVALCVSEATGRDGRYELPRYLLVEGVRNILPSNGGSGPSEEGCGRLRLASVALFTHYCGPEDGRDVNLAPAEFLLDLAWDPHNGPYRPVVEGLASAQVIAILRLVADLSQRLIARFHSPEIFVRGQDGSRRGSVWQNENITLLLLDLLTAREKRCEEDLVDDAYLPLLQTWCLMHAAHAPQETQESKKRIFECLYYFSKWQERISKARSQAFSDRVWQADVNFVCVSLGGPKVAADQFPAHSVATGNGAAGGTSCVLNRDTAVQAGEVTVAAPSSPHTHTHTRSVARQAGRTLDTTPSVSSPGSGISLGSIIRGSSRSAKRKAWDSVEAPRKGRVGQEDNLGLEREAVRVRAPEGREETSRGARSSPPAPISLVGEAALAPMDEEGDDLLGEPPTEGSGVLSADRPLAVQSITTSSGAAPAVIEEHKEEKNERNDAVNKDGKEEKQEGAAAEGWAGAAADAINKKFGSSF